jgi:hypothetical protein
MSLLIYVSVQFSSIYPTDLLFVKFWLQFISLNSFNNHTFFIRQKIYTKQAHTFLSIFRFSHVKLHNACIRLNVPAKVLVCRKALT